MLDTKNIKKVKYGYNERYTFGKTKQVMELPYLLEIQKDSYYKFLNGYFKYFAGILFILLMFLSELLGDAQTVIMFVTLIGFVVANVFVNKKIEKEENLPEDTVKGNQEDIQKLTDKFVGLIDTLVADKEKEVMTV